LTFTKESDFENALIEILSHKGWEKNVITYPTEKELIKNWANILFDNNRGIDRLGDHPLTDSEMQQILEQITGLRTPHKLNGFINSKTVSITRDNPCNTLHFGKEVRLKYTIGGRSLPARAAITLSGNRNSPQNQRY
jgi:type I restriction enzyme R subunit